MKEFLIIPDINNLNKSLELAREYSLGYEYNDFYIPNVLDDKEKLQQIVNAYKYHELPQYTTIHGAFFDVIPFSPDEKIREISLLRIEQSIEAAMMIGAKAVVFHTNYNPFLNTDAYVSSFVQKNIEIWGRILEKYTEISVYIENMFDTSPDIMEKISEGLCKYPNYGVCLDYAHASISGVAPEIWAERLGKYVKHIHVNDNDLISDLHLAWGSGKIDRNMFYECYNKYMSDATILIETTSIENQLLSIEVMKKEGFFD